MPAFASAGAEPAAEISRFRSFWWGGFEGADHVNAQGVALDLVATTGHAAQVRGDYRRARALGMRTVRESIGWRRTMGRDGPDFTRPVAMADEAGRQGVEIVWTLWHYGFPPDVDPFSEQALDAFEAFAFAAGRALAGRIPDDAWFNPVNEPSFLTWLLTEGRALPPFTTPAPERAAALKRNLVRAGLRATRAIRASLPRARFLHVDPICHVAAPGDAPELAGEAARYCDALYESWDLLFDPTVEPSIPVDERCHAVGVNHYHNSQWELGSRRVLRWHLDDPRRRPPSELLADVAARYLVPVVLAETSHVGSGRPDWLAYIGDQCARARANGVPLVGACLYPVVDRHDWERTAHWHQSGLWDAIPRGHPRGPRRIPNRPYCNAFKALVLGCPADGRASPHSTGAPMDTLVVFSHLRWDSVFQRPQHLMSRIARRYRVLFVEEPVLTDGDARVELVSPLPQLTVMRPHTPIQAGGFHDEQLPTLRRLLGEVMRKLDVGRYGVWTYTPMALPLLQDLAPCVICYDCMDELSAFRYAPKQLVQRESALLRAANVVFTGGPSLHDSKKDRHDNVHCFPSSVDAGHFGRGRREDEAHADVAALPHPRLGYYGVVDERFDADLLSEVAALRPDWHFFVVGPVVKIDPATLPGAANVHYLPQQPYAVLPSLLAGWDVCLLPFARNESTRFISPTKTLEYLAADKPVVGTPIADVVRLYGQAVRFAETAPEFVAQCEHLLQESLVEQRARVSVSRDLVQRTSWDDTARRMIGLVEEAATHGLRREAVALLSGSHPPKAVTLPPAPRHAECLILGAGPTGLSAAYHYGERATLLERERTVGGWCRSIRDNGFTFDCAGHIMFSNDPDVQELYVRLLGDNVLWQDREAWIWSKGTYTRYPFQGALYGLPPDVLRECIVGAIEARYGSLRAVADADAPAVHTDCCADGTGLPGGAVATARDGRGAPRNFEEFIHATWGSGIAKHFAIPYNRKLWTYPLSEMETSWLGGRVPLPDLEQMIEGALSPVPKPMGPNARFGYPLRGGFQALMDGFLPLLKGPLELEAEVRRVVPSRHQVHLADGRTFGYETLVSTLPLPDLVAAIGDEAPAEVRAAAGRLRRVSVRCVNLGIGRAGLTDKHWIYYPEDTIFHRIFVQGNASPLCNPPGGFGLTCEISYSPAKPLPLEGDALIRRCIDDCIRVGILRADDPVWAANEVDMPYAYVLYDHDRQASVDLIRGWLAEHDILLAGRYSEWQYYNSDHAFLAGRNAARLAASRASEGAAVTRRTRSLAG